MAAAIKDEFGVEAKVIKGSGGVFDVKVNGEAVFSKAETGRFPEPEEILQTIRGRL